MDSEPAATKKPLISSELKKQIAHIVAFTAAAVLVGITNMTGEPNEEYKISRVQKPDLEQTKEAVTPAAEQD